MQTIKRITNSLTAKDIILPNRFIVALLLNNLSKEYKYVTAIITQTIRIEDKKEIDLDQIINQLLDESRRLKGIKSTKNYSYSLDNNYSKNNKSTSYNKDTRYENNVEMYMQTSNNSRFSNNSKNKTKNNNLKCNYCNLKGHIEQNCYKKHLHLRPAKKVNNSLEEEVKKQESILLTSKTKSKNKVIDFILDSRATVHTCCIKELFTTISPTTTTIK